MCGSIGQTYATAVPKPLSSPIPSPRPSAVPSSSLNPTVQANYTDCLSKNSKAVCDGLFRIGQTYATAVPKPLPSPPSTTSSNDSLTTIYNVLNTVTFGGFGNYVQTYQNINAQNPQASYLEKAFNPSGMAASAQLGTILTAEGAILFAGGTALAPFVTQAAATVGSAATLTYINATNTIAASPTLQTVVGLTQAAGNILPGATAVTLCQLYGTNTPECQNAASVAIPAAQISMAQQATQSLADQLSAKPAALPSSGTIPIDQLSPHEPGYNVQTVDALSGIVKKGGSLDPVEITVYNNQIYTVNGANRITATMQTGGSTVQYTLTPYKNLNPTLQTMVKQINSSSSIIGIPIPSSYTNFTPAYNYMPKTIRP
jgi:hypothetical protein